MKCFTCERGQPHSIVLVYRYFHFWYELGRVYRREHFLECDRCRSGMSIEPTDYREIDTGHDPIPFLHRRGILLFTVGLPLAILILSVLVFAMILNGLL
jgi:hypothetical protein